jgi:hypothetical protein
LLGSFASGARRVGSIAIQLVACVRMDQSARPIRLTLHVIAGFLMGAQSALEG